LGKPAARSPRDDGLPNAAALLDHRGYGEFQREAAMTAGFYLRRHLIGIVDSV